jgi:SAM-dependent methyltransferase
MGTAEREILAERVLSVSSEDYWRRIFKNNPDFSSWQTQKQLHVRNELIRKLDQDKRQLRILDYGIGNMALYLCFDDDLLARIHLTGMSESLQHDANDRLNRKFKTRILVGEGLSPFSQIPSESKDYVISSYVLAYLPESRRAELIEECCRVLVPDGELILILHHPNSRRKRKFELSERYWMKTRQLYVHLLERKYQSAQADLNEITGYLDATFSDDASYRKYLESYLKTGAKFLQLLSLNGSEYGPIPREALLDCKRMIRLIQREFTMTCHAFQPIKNPRTDIVLPPELSVSELTECLDPTDQTPIANFYTAIKRPLSKDPN